jgi:polyisoprenoid-binding protein YceI
MKDFTMKYIIMILLLLGLTASLSGVEEYSFDEMNGWVEGQASTFMHDFPVKVKKFTVKISSVNKNDTRDISVRIPVEAITTEHERRDDHMFDGVLLKDRFPLITYHAVSDVVHPREGPFTLTGTLTIHDIEKPFTIRGNIRKENKHWVAEADFTVLLSDFNLSRPGFGPMKVRDKVELSLYLNRPLERE